MTRLKQILLISTLAIASSSYVQADKIHAYYFDDSIKDVELYREFKEGDFNPYWFEEEDSKSTNFAYEVSSNDTPLYREFKKGDFNPYWFEN